MKEFAESGFGWLAYLMAYIYVCVRLLPPNHPYMLPANFGRFGIRHVIAEAANRIELRRDNIDQIVVFFVLLIGFIALVAQFAVLAATFIIHPAWAAPDPGAFGGFFSTPKPANDIAFELLDKVFAIPNMFNSQYAPASDGAIPPFNDALHKLLKFYNFAILIVAVAIFLYYMVLVVAETANTGTPFGRRFSHIYAPIRLVVAVGLLVPLNYGLNSAQYITLFAAKYGSSLATNTWLLFNQTINEKGGGNGTGKNPLGSSGETLLARPEVPSIASVVEFLALARACKHGYEEVYVSPPYAATQDAAAKTDIEPYLVGATTVGSVISGNGGQTQASYEAAVGPNYFNNHDITIVIGHRDVKLYPTLKDNVYPFCGTMTIHIGDVTQKGSTEMQKYYYELVRDVWSDPVLEQFAERATAIYLPTDPNSGADGKPTPDTVTVDGDSAGNSRLPTESWRQEQVNKRIQKLTTTVHQARDDMVTAQATFDMQQQVLDRGWGGAAIWYNRIAMWNGALFGAVFSTPTASGMPSALQKVERERRINDENVNQDNRYEPYLNPATNKPVGIEPGELDLVHMMAQVTQYWELDAPTTPMVGHTTADFFLDILNKIFPIDSLMQIRYNVDVHPLAQLVGLGKSLIDSTVRNLTIGLGFAAGGGLVNAMQDGLGAPISYVSTVALSLTTITLTIGFILYYVLPFMPFIYFFFAVGSWVKTIFEAMVGVPLWALAHLRIDGNGLAGDRALDGYFLIFEIFLRPVLILFGLLGGLLFFTAMARTLHDVFTLVVANVTGFDQTLPDAQQGPVQVSAYQGNLLDEFFYTIIYTIVLYSLALSSFKMIDQIPSGVMRWMGAGVRGFADDQRDPAGAMLGYVAYGGNRVASQLTGGMNQAADAAGGLVGGALKSIAGRNGSRVAGKNSAEK